jgi:PAS domain S-box-containing protein
MSDKGSSFQQNGTQDKAISQEQLLNYARDLAEAVQEEGQRREALEAANRKLTIEVMERKSAQEKLAESEERYRTLFEDSRDAIYITDGDGRFIDVNLAFLGLFGCNKAEIMGKAPAKLCNASTWLRLIREIGEYGSVKDHEAEFHKSDGTIMQCLVTATFQRTRDGRVSRCLGIIRDVTAQRLSQELLQHAKKMEALSNLAGCVAHEVRNPLAISSSAAQLLMEDEVPETFRKDCAKKIVSGLQRASFIIENLLAFARPTSESEMISLDLGSLVRESERSIAGQARDRGVKLIFKFCADQLIINGNPSLLMQALMNLYVNALESMRDSGGILTTRMKKNGLHALITVSDTGNGILDDRLDKVFDPFFTESPRAKGLGLGLSISYSIVNQHAGTISVQSTPGSGTTFAVKFPLAR